MLKHVGKMKHNNAKVCVVYRTLPGEAYSALVVGTSTLSEQYHNAMIKEVESLQGQESNELGDLLNTRYFPDGTNMLHQLHLTKKLVKVPTDGVVMTPSSNSEIMLDQLNIMIAEQKNVAIDDLAITSDSKQHRLKSENVDVKDISDPGKNQDNIEITDHTSKTTTSSNNVESLVPPPKSTETIKPLESARDYRSEADRLYKEAAKLRKMADELDPPKKKVSSVASTEEATQ
jgi:hypothetical protein